MTWHKIEQYFSTTKSPVQLVKHYDEVPDSTKLKNMQWPAIMQKKYDGVYCMIVKIGSKFRFYSRTGNEFYSGLYQTFVATHLDKLPDGCFVTECVNHELSLEQLSGAVNTNRVEPWDAELLPKMVNSTNFIFHDFLTVQQLLAGKTEVPYEHRLQELQKIGGICIAYSVTAWSYEDWLVFVNEAVNSDWEGAVLKQMHAGWKAGHKGWHVMKDVRGIHVDLRCIGVVIGTGKFDGLISGLTFEWKGKRFNAGLGKGWDLDTMRAHTMAWQLDEFNVINQIWHVSALQESSKGVLRLPKVNEMRIDKEIEDAHY